MPRTGDVMILKSDATLKPVKDFTAQIQTLDIPGEVKAGYSPIGFVRCGRSACRITGINWKVRAGVGWLPGWGGWEWGVAGRWLGGGPAAAAACSGGARRPAACRLPLGQALHLHACPTRPQPALPPPHSTPPTHHHTQQVGKETGGKKLEAPHSLKANEMAEVVFEPCQPLVVDSFKNCEGLSRIAFLDGNTAVMLGKVVKTTAK